MDKFTLIEIFMKFLKRADYENAEAFSQDEFEKTLQILERDRENVFRIFYGDRKIKRGGLEAKEFDYRFAEALIDVKHGYIKSTMHYLLTQIRIGDLTL